MNADEVWDDVSAEVESLHRPFLGGGSAFAGLDRQTLNLLRIVACTAWRMSAEETTREFEQAIERTAH